MGGRAERDLGFREDQVVCYLGMEGRGIGRAEEVSSCESSARRAARTPPSLAPRRRAAEVLSRRRNIAAGVRCGCPVRPFGKKHPGPTRLLIGPWAFPFELINI